jgi:cobalt-zinc-cadmium efflux system protein
MGHSHHHPQGPCHAHNANARKGLALAFFLNLSFAIIEIIGGLLTNSIAILSDALHDLGDASALGLAWYLEKVSSRQADAQFSYGYRRYSLLAALITGGILIFGSLIIVWNAVERLMNPQPVHATGMIALALLGIAVNGFAYSRLHHGHSHNERAVSLHLLEDVLGWVAVFIGALIMKFYDLPWIDPLLSLVIAAFILKGAVTRVRDTSLIFLQRVPIDVNLSELHTELLKVEGVSKIEDLHVWSTDGQDLIVTLSVRAQKNFNSRAEMRLALTQKLGALAEHHVTIEILDADENSLGCPPPRS